MPLVQFTFLPDDSLVWVFGSPVEISGEAEQQLLTRVDAFLEGWKAHGNPLSAGRNWRDRRFLTIAVDNTRESASGCSIDTLFHELKTLEPILGTTLLNSGNIYYHGENGEIKCVDRAQWIALGEKGEVDRNTVVFDFTVRTLGDWRSGFEKRASRSWHGSLLPAIAK